MTDEECHAILTQRGYRTVEIDRWHDRILLFVEPVREGPKAITKLCQKWSVINLDAEGLHFLLDHYCELKGGYYTDEQRRNNQRGATCCH